MRRAVLLLLIGLALSFPTSGDDESPIRFATQTLPFPVENCETNEKYQPEIIMGGGIGLLDHDNDGLLDIFLANGAAMPGLRKESKRYHNRLLRNLGGFRFEDVAEKAGVTGVGYDMAAAVGDYDNDGFADLFVGGVHRYTLYRNNGDGTFRDVTHAAGISAADKEYGHLWAVAAAWIDIDNDGRLDLFVSNYCVWDPATEKRCVLSGRRDYCHPTNYAPLPNSVFRNNGDGTFTDVSVASGVRSHLGKGMGVSVADYDGDGTLDVFVANDKTPNYLFKNIGGGRFREVALESGVAYIESGESVSGMGCDFRDVDNDGLPDIFFTAMRDETFPLFRNGGNGFFDDVTYSTRLSLLTNKMAGWSCGIFDFDNDGWKDLFVARGDVLSSKGYRGETVKEQNAVFRQTPGKRFDDVSRAAGLMGQPPRLHRGAAFGDLDNDGRVDVVVSALESDLEVWHNVSGERGERGHWITLKLEGTRSNRSAIGAGVRVQTAAGRQWNHVTSSVGYASSSDLRVHFGLGSADRVAEIEVRWPSGQVQRLVDLPVDREIQIREPAEPIENR